MSANRYAPWVRRLHWAVAWFIVFTLVLIEIKGWFPRGSATRTAVKWGHMQFGIAVLLLMLPRLLVRLRHAAPPITPPLPRWQDVLSKLVHLSLYLLAFAVPLLGVSMMFIAGKPWNLLGLPLPVMATPDPVLKAGIAHLWFVTIHPFDDGNGRIARAIADLALARAEGTAQRFYSMSAQIRTERKAYYDMLEATQKGDLDITPWLVWFIDCLDHAFDGAEVILAGVIRKARFWEAIAEQKLNERQRKIINRLLDGFEGKLTSGKWAALAKCSPDTALRDISELIRLGVLRRSEAGGRSTSYELSGTGERA